MRERVGGHGVKEVTVSQTVKGHGALGENFGFYSEFRQSQRVLSKEGTWPHLGLNDLSYYCEKNR